MLGPVFLCIAIAAYMAAAWRMTRLFTGDTAGQRPGDHYSLLIAGVALLAHVAYVMTIGNTNHGLNFGLSSMAVVVSAIIVLTFLLGCLGMEISRLGILVFPLASLCLVFSFLWGSPQTATEHTLWPISAFSAHVLVAILAYSLLSIATIQSLLYVYQEKQFKNRAAPTVLAALPPLQTMEQLLFRLLWIGFVLLTLTLLSGALFSQQIFGQAFDFNHHTVLAVLGWLVFGILLLKRAKSGVRGPQATLWTVAGFVLIQLGYFGTKIINESFNL